MNVYVQFGLAMCAITVIALVATGYLAASFNRRAKADLAAALGPLADLIGGKANVEEAEVQGSYAGHLVSARMANATEGPGRVFQTDLIDAAGGTSWRLTSDPPKQTGGEPRERLDTDDPGVAAALPSSWADVARGAVDSSRDRFRLEYDAEAGRLRFSRPMRTRRDIPDRDALEQQFVLLVRLGPLNRRAQGAPDADWAGGRRASSVAEGE